MRIFGIEIKRAFNPIGSKEYKLLELKHKDKLSQGYWIGSCSSCNWLGLSDETKVMNYSETNKDGIGLYESKGIIRLCPECYKKNIISVVYDCSDL